MLSDFINLITRTVFVLAYLILLVIMIAGSILLLCGIFHCMFGESESRPHAQPNEASQRENAQEPEVELEDSETDDYEKDTESLV
ncbi:hypothetical protein P170DRAFT_509186 [Aspergillus steynii IBT 23096]|uniref:Uncharacterized protein n=1 Tax=Aspergillus steynii IBT 23096 TaxID=1392250 RepID=A0A2I2GE56_9EURO|nr:uncharacterized protein P170DRAFT_509186 [Aspergillus steynii IBT 23096]PLB51153.1 hypothetical protein P170DRAFT_509186 [Aspergillus steynii IBT 23096]